MISKEWDQSLKFLTKTSPQSFVSLVLEDASFLQECDKELQSRTIHADLVYEVQWHGEHIILHAEFQRSRDENMARRVWEYNVLIECTTQLPVYSVVLYLVKDGNAIEPPYERRLCTGELIHRFHFRNLKMWEIDASELRQPGMEGMLPLLTLTKDGARREMVNEVISDLARVERQDLLPVAYCVAALVFPAQGANQQWLKERFGLMHNLFQDSWAYQEMVAEGLQEGRQKGLQEGLQEGLRKSNILYVQKHFPLLAERAKQQINLIDDINRLQMTFDAMLDATTATEVEEILTQMTNKPEATQ